MLQEAISKTEARGKNPLVLAYIGDTVYDLFARMHVLKKENALVNQLNQKVIGIVNAKAQAKSAEQLLLCFSEEELAIYKRGRNAKPATVPKNMTVSDYHKATGLEAVIGYLYLIGEKERLDQLFQIILGNEGQA